MLWMLLALSGAWAQEGCLPGMDCDGDGFTIEQGDCDESNADVHPGEPENCANDLDDDCDGLFNEGCDRAVQQGQLGGGSTCYAVDGGPAPQDTGLAMLLPLPLLPLLIGWRRRERDGE